MSLLDKLVAILPRIRTQLQLTGLITLVAGFLIIRGVAPGQLQAQISAGAIGVVFLVFAQIFSRITSFPAADRSKLVLFTFSMFFVFILLLIALTGYFLSRSTPEGKLNAQLSLDDAAPPEKNQAYFRVWDMLPKSLLGRNPRLPDGGRVEEPDLGVRYTFHQAGDTAVIRPSIPYAERFADGGPIESVSYDYGGAFSWEFPQISIQATNSSPKPVQITSVRLHVRRASVDTEPLLTLDQTSELTPDGESDYYVMRFNNEGWGPVRNARIRIRAADPREFNRLNWTLPAQHEVVADTFTHVLSIPVEPYLDRTLLLKKTVGIKSMSFALLYGTIEYNTVDGGARRKRFRAILDVSDEYGAGHLESSHTYTVCLPTNARDMVISVPGVSQVLEADSSDRFNVRIAADRTASFIVDVSLRTVDRAEIPVGPLNLKVFVPVRGDWTSSQQDAPTIQCGQRPAIPL